MSVLKWIEGYIPDSPAETQAKQRGIALLKENKKIFITRENPNIHLTVSAFVMDPTLRYTLMVYHNIYDSFSWLGGHADGEEDLLGVATREAREEANLTDIFPISADLLSMEILPVPAHSKNGKTIVAHEHFNVTFGFIATREQLIAPNLKENSAVRWIPVEQLSAYVTEEEMLPIYQKLIAAMQRYGQLLCGGENPASCDLTPMVFPLLFWYEKHARELPWRENKEPYKVWLSEIMLQQTRVSAVIGYYERFLKQLPDIPSLANADEGLLLKLWEGLGYYSRVRNLKKAAQVIVSEYDGKMPEDLAALSTLPGIGAYTAGAIASICFEKPSPAVDGNVMRVITHITANRADILLPATKKTITAQLEAVYPAGRCGDFTQSLMELGATVCLPNGAPLCEHCPVAFVCRAYRANTQLDYPVKQPKKARRIEERRVFLLYHNGRFALQQRADKGLLASLWEFPNGMAEIPLEEQLNSWGILAKRTEPLERAKHIFTHIEWHMVGCFVECEAPDARFIWASPQELESHYSIPSAFRAYRALALQYANTNQNQQDI